ncbi:hypothetical protein K461DRAFT_319307 [Myriangium duriaei CBS 260.36]|uniref:Protein kinase domain-containing protein n=1 Tax=Myriangium duriaei CBS 260.36 TaxID=1168546 RepID=A0A9P4J9I9_9PEZI|nr:hypothetical protein K461DRAFT_319307 [Myriangium duriaei CBS 260.36]
MSNVDKPVVKYRLSKFQWPDGTDVDPKYIVAIGNLCVLLRHPDSPNILLKAPGYSLEQEDDGSWTANNQRDEMCTRDFERELVAYGRLAGVEGVVGFHGVQLGCLAMDYHPLGSLKDRFDMTADPPPIQLRLSWMSQAIHIIAACHKAHVLLFDIALRNFVIANDNSLRAIDFCDATVLPTDVDINSVNVFGATTKIDLFYLANVLYSLATWSYFQRSCVLEATGSFESTWPALDPFPSVMGVPWGSLILGCWHRHFDTAEQVVKYCNSRRVRRRLKRQGKVPSQDRVRKHDNTQDLGRLG